MKIKIPILKEEFDNDSKSIKTQEEFIEGQLNFTLDAQITWEENFPEQAKRIGLFDYVEQMQDVKAVDVSTLLIQLKIIYCFMLFNKEMSFREFVRLFTFDNPEYVNKLSSVLAGAIKAVNERYSGKKNF